MINISKYQQIKKSNCLTCLRFLGSKVNEFIYNEEIFINDNDECIFNFSMNKCLNVISL